VPFHHSLAKRRAIIQNAGSIVQRRLATSASDAFSAPGMPCCSPALVLSVFVSVRCNCSAPFQLREFSLVLGYPRRKRPCLGFHIDFLAVRQTFRVFGKYVDEIIHRRIIPQA
jgi:hypothetical protein